jgi:uncharacterized protein YbgA (DUF1722 family)/uncharacterized protein YbbK (DUF523 family)
MSEPIKIGISACLLGEKVRWNGVGARDPFLTDTLGRFVRWVPVCPEVECGLPVPRETLRLVGDVNAPRLVTSRTGIDHTERMQSWARQRLDRLEGQDLCGFIFKKDSPSSGLMRVKVYNDKGMPEKKGVGMFARAFTERFPRVPAEEEGRLHDPRLRENFIERVFTLQRWRQALKEGPTQGRLVDFHTQHKLLLMAHSPAHYQALGRMVAAGRKEAPEELFDRYEQGLLEALSLKATVKKHVNVLQHMLGYFKKELSADEKQEMLTLIDRYRQELVPLVVPVTLINHYVRKYGQSYLASQVYLNPHPVELKLRNHA